MLTTAPTFSFLCGEYLLKIRLSNRHRAYRGLSLINTLKFRFYQTIKLLFVLCIVISYPLQFYVPMERWVFHMIRYKYQDFSKNVNMIYIRFLELKSGSREKFPSTSRQCTFIRHDMAVLFLHVGFIISFKRF